MSTAGALQAESAPAYDATEEDTPGPIVINRSVNSEGATYALETDSYKRLRERFGPEVPKRGRMFITHNTAEDYEKINGTFAPQIIILLTGVTEERLQELGVSCSRIL